MGPHKHLEENKDMKSGRASLAATYGVFLSGVLTAVIGGAGLLGWAIDVQWLTALWPHLQAMRPNAALAMLLSGLSLLLLLPLPLSAWHRWTGRSLAMVVLLISGIALFSIFTGVDIPANAVLFQQDKFPVASVGPEHFPLRMGLPAAAGFLLNALALLLLDVKDRAWRYVSLFLSLATAAVGVFGLTGHAYNAAVLYSLTTYTVISAHIALGLVFLGVGVPLARPGSFPISLLLSQGAVGTVGRRLLVPIVLGPAVLGWMWLHLEQQSWLSLPEAMAGFVLLIILVLMGFTCWCMAAVARVDQRRDRAEEALRESEGRYRNLFENMTEEVHFWKLVRDDEGSIKTWRLVDANPPTLKTWGKGLDEIRGMTTDEIFGPGATEHYMPVVRKIMTENLPHSFEDYFPNLQRYFRFTSVPLGDYFITTGTDITDIKKSQDELRKAQSIAHIGSWYWDAKTDATTGSDELLSIYGFDPSTQSMPSFREQKGLCYPAEDWERVNAAVQNTLKTGIGYELDVHVIRDNVLIWVTTRGEVIRDAEDRIIGLRGTVQDINERKKAEEEIRRLGDDLLERNEELEFSNKELESFIYSVSHDLRAPLRHISGFTDLVIKGSSEKLDEKGRRYLSNIHAGAEKMSHLIDDLLNLSRISRQEIKRTQVNISEIAASIVSELRESHSGKRVEIDIKGGLTEFADRGLTEIVLSNLIGNAWKFTSKTEHARIALGILDRNGKSIFYIRDNGAGFNQEYAGKMFWPFHRLHSDAAFEGTGIGLAIVERIIRLHGGRVWAEGEEGKGATIYFSLT